MYRRLLVTLVLFAPIIASAQTKSPSIEGVWQVTSFVAVGTDPATISKPLPSLVIFTKGHYTWLSVNGTTPRPTFGAPRDPRKLTDAEKIARYEQWNPFTAQGGTYQVNGNTLTRRPTVAKNEAVMAANRAALVQQFKIEGNKLMLIEKSAPGEPPNESTTTLMRVE